MKLRFLCANHRQWLCSQPHQAAHCCANSFETGWHLSQQGYWEEALPHMGCAFETAEILMTSRTIDVARAVAWFIHALAGLTQTLEKLNRPNDCVEVLLAASDRLRKEVTQSITPQLEATIYLHITRLNRERRRMDPSGKRRVPRLTLVESKRGERVFH